MLLALVPIVALPWLQGFQPAAIADRGSREVASRLARWRAPDEDCVASAYGGLELAAELAPSPGSETVLASFSQGVVVLDRDGHALARAPGFACAGSADELVAIAAGDAWIGAPVLALAAAAGGHAEHVTWLTLYRVGDGGRLEPAFTGVVETRAGRVTRTGEVTIVPGALIYRAPDGDTSVWTYDPDAGRYVESGGFGSAARA